MTRPALLALLAALSPAAAHAQTPPADATRIGRSAVPKAPEFQELYDFDAAAKTLADATFPYESRLHRAHVVMLAERGVLTRADAAAILRGLDVVDAQAASDPKLRTYLPYEAALIRAIGPVAGRMHTGQLTAILTSLNAIEYQHSVARVPLEPRQIDALMAATHAMTGVVRTLQPDRARMLRLARENYSTMTDLADALVRESGIDFREAHEIIARVVTEAIDRGLTADRITPAMVERAARAQLGRPLRLPPAALRDALDPARGVARRNGVGGPARSSVEAMIATAQGEIAAERRRLAERRGRLEQASAALDQAITALSN